MSINSCKLLSSLSQHFYLVFLVFSVQRAIAFTWEGSTIFKTNAGAFSPAQPLIRNVQGNPDKAPLHQSRSPSNSKASITMPSRHLALLV